MHISFSWIGRYFSLKLQFRKCGIKIKIIMAQFAFHHVFEGKKKTDVAEELRPDVF